MIKSVVNITNFQIFQFSRYTQSAIVAKMSTWYQEVHTLVQKCLDSADEVLTEVEKNCEGNLTIEFIDEFFKLLAKK